jgi:hypothetical protein
VVSASSRRSRRECVEPPRSLEALEVVWAAIVEVVTAAEEQIVDGRRYEQAVVVGGCLDAGGEVDGGARDVAVLADLDLAGVDPASDVESEIGDGTAELDGKVERLRRTDPTVELDRVKPRYPCDRLAPVALLQVRRGLRSVAP